jgi:adrenodoxin-NADP+ reductase
LKQTIKDAKIDILERLPTPFGLVRSGVAPDHPEVKNVQNEFAALFEGKDACRFWGNVTLGRDISLVELRRIYDAVVLAYGCESEKKLGIPGEETLQGVLSAREFVAWYNGHPDYGHIGDAVHKAIPKPEEAHVAVIGQGNVALDCARILAKGGPGLQHTDIASYALPILGEGVKSTTILGRRGHIQGAFTIKELRELTKLEADGHNASFVVRPEELDRGTTESSLKELEGPTARPRKRIDKLLREVANQPLSCNVPKSVTLRFLLRPVSFEPNQADPAALGSLVCEQTRLEGDPGEQMAVGTGLFEELPAKLALVSVGYKGVPVLGLEDGFFDAGTGTISNRLGKVADSTGELCGLYVSGWLKRGPSGIIGTNIADAKDTVASIAKDCYGAETSCQRNESSLMLASLLEERSVQFVDWEAYKRIDATETNFTRRRSEGQPREKLTTRRELLAAAGTIGD